MLMFMKETLMPVWAIAENAFSSTPVVQIATIDGFDALDLVQETFSSPLTSSDKQLNLL